MATVELYKDIGLDPTFKKTIDFTSKAQQRNWFNTKSRVTYDNVNYNKLQNTLKINTDVSFDEALSYTYAIVSEIEASSTRRYYCFINKVTLISTETIEFELAIDPIQTFMCEYSIGESMVTREHVDRWSPNSNYPIRITPNNISINANSIVSTGFDIVQNIENNGSGKNYLNPSEMGHCIVCYTKRDSATNTVKIVKAIFPFSKYSDGYIYGDRSVISGAELTYKNMVFPTVVDLLQGRIPTMFDIPPEDIVYMGVLPIVSFKLSCYTVSWDSYPHYIYENISDKIISEHYKVDDNYSFAMYAVTDTFTDISSQQIFNISTVSKPTASSTAMAKYEPALSIEPFQKVVITDGTGQIKLTIPEKFVMSGTIALNIRTLLGNAGVYNILSLYDNYAAAGTEGASTIIEANYMDVFNDKWLTYAVTQRDTDRQLISNGNIQNAIDNLIFMSYGGSLVASRGASGNDTTQRRQKNILTGVTQAVGLAAGASIVSSLVDSHFAWENQKLNETKIKNQPNNLLLIGTGSAMINIDTMHYHIYYVKCDAENIKNHYQNFMKYGYEVNKFEVPDIRSRKYFNYILTDGCIIVGSLNTVIKQELASIFDNGITIFHGDYSSTLDYPTTENIERSLL